MINNTDFATFIYDATNGPIGHTGFYGTTAGTFTQVNEPLENCCVRFSTLNKGVPFTNPLKTPITINKVQSKLLDIFPNPNFGNTVNLKYKFVSIGNIQVSIINMQGVVVFYKPIFVPISKLEITSSIKFSDTFLPSGLYTIKLTNGTETLISKLVITK